MSRLVPTLLGALVLCGVAAASVSGPYVGHSGAGRMSFSISANGRYITHFRFVNRCPADSNKGTLVNGRMKIHDGATFSRHDMQFTITGRFTSSGAKGTARDVTGDCDSGKLHWTAQPVHD